MQFGVRRVAIDQSTSAVRVGVTLRWASIDLSPAFQQGRYRDEQLSEDDALNGPFQRGIAKITLQR